MCPSRHIQADVVATILTLRIVPVPVAHHHARRAMRKLHPSATEHERNAFGSVHQSPVLHSDRFVLARSTGGLIGLLAERVRYCVVERSGRVLENPLAGQRIDIAALLSEPIIANLLSILVFSFVIVLQLIAALGSFRPLLPARERLGF